MSRRLIAQSTSTTRPGVDVRVYRDTEWEEFIVYFIIDGKRDEPSSYHTDDKGDAISQMLRYALATAEQIPTQARN